MLDPFMVPCTNGRFGRVSDDHRRDAKDQKRRLYNTAQGESAPAVLRAIPIVPIQVGVPTNVLKGEAMRPTSGAPVPQPKPKVKSAQPTDFAAKLAAARAIRPLDLPANPLFVSEK